MIGLSTGGTLMSTRWDRAARRRKRRRVIVDVAMTVTGIVTLMLVWLAMRG
jgi:hypothetical protein